MTVNYSTGVVRNGRVELALSPTWPEGTEVIVLPNANDAVAAIEQAELAQLAAITPSDEELSSIAIAPPRKWLEEDLCDAVETSEAVRAYTAALFAGKATVAVVRDPEFGDRSFVVYVETRGGVE